MPMKDTDRFDMFMRVTFYIGIILVIMLTNGMRKGMRADEIINAWLFVVKLIFVYSFKMRFQIWKKRSKIYRQ